jgi:hypothetical protein
MKLSRRSRAPAALFVALFSSASLADESAAAPEQASTDAVEHCIRDHERARLLRVSERWFEARARMLACAREACPLVIRSDCRNWLDEVARIVPTFVVLVERDDAGEQPVRLELDGQRITLSEPAQAIEATPGRHRLRIELDPYPAVEREIVLQKGEKNHLVRVRFARPQPPAAVAPISRLPPPLRPTRPIQPATYWLSAAALGAFVGSGVLLASALSSRSDARATCAPACDSDRRKSIETRLLLADVSAGVGLVLGGLAVYTFASRPVVYERTSVLAVSLAVGRNRSELSLNGRF